MTAPANTAEVQSTIDYIRQVVKGQSPTDYTDYAYSLYNDVYTQSTYENSANLVWANPLQTIPWADILTYHDAAMTWYNYNNTELTPPQQHDLKTEADGTQTAEAALATTVSTNASSTTTALAAKADASSTTTSLGTKVDKVTGKGLSTDDVKNFVWVTGGNAPLARTAPIEFVAQQNVATGVAVVQLTADGTSTGTALFPNGIDYMKAEISDAGNSYNYGYALTNSNKTLTVTASVINVALGLLSFASAANGKTVNILVKGY